jgi:hypothetical protein
MSASPTVVEQGGSKPGGWLRANRLKLTLWIGAIEGVLVLLGLLPHLAVYLLAAIAIGFYILVGRKYTSPSARMLTWIFASSQLIAVLVPAVLHIAKWIAITAIIAAAVVGLVLLFAERDKS